MKYRAVQIVDGYRTLYPQETLNQAIELAMVCEHGAGRSRGAVEVFTNGRWEDLPPHEYRGERWWCECLLDIEDGTDFELCNFCKAVV